MVVGEDSGITFSLAIAMLVGFVTVWWRIEAKFSSQASAVRRAEKELDAYKLHVAETYATRAGAGQAIDRAIEEVKALRADVRDGLTGLRQETSAGLSNLGDRIERMENHVLSRPAGAQS